MKRASVYLHDYKAGTLTEDENGYTFLYDKPYQDKVLFPFFDGLIPEGWLLNIAEKSWKINQRDRMSLLLACCRDCIGAVSIIPNQTEE